MAIFENLAIFQNPQKLKYQFFYATFLIKNLISCNEANFLLKIHENSWKNQKLHNLAKIRVFSNETE